jgi:hypothetical protein
MVLDVDDALPPWLEEGRCAPTLTGATGVSPLGVITSTVFKLRLRYRFANSVFPDLGNEVLSELAVRSIVGDGGERTLVNGVVGDAAPFGVVLDTELFELVRRAARL